MNGCFKYLMINYRSTFFRSSESFTIVPGGPHGEKKLIIESSNFTHHTNPESDLLKLRDLHKSIPGPALASKKEYCHLRPVLGLLPSDLMRDEVPHRLFPILRAFSSNRFAVNNPLKARGCPWRPVWLQGRLPDIFLF